MYYKYNTLHLMALTLDKLIRMQKALDANDMQSLRDELNYKIFTEKVIKVIETEKNPRVDMMSNLEFHITCSNEHKQMCGDAYDPKGYITVFTDGCEYISFKSCLEGAFVYKNHYTKVEGDDNNLTITFVYPPLTKV